MKPPAPSTCPHCRAPAQPKQPKKGVVYYVCWSWWTKGKVERSKTCEGRMKT